MALTPEQLEQVKESVKSALDEHKKEFWVDPESHYLQHKFVQDMMSAQSTVKKVGITTMVSIAVGYVVKAVFFKAG